MSSATAAATTTMGEAPKEPFFSIDLGANGGRFEPTTLDEIHTWLATENNSWSWIHSTNVGDHRSAIQYALEFLAPALHTLQEARNLVGNDVAVLARLSIIKEHVQTTFEARGFPHSTSNLGLRVHALKEDDPIAAIAYLFAFLPGQSYRFDGRDLQSWRGFVMGLNDRFDINTNIEPAIRAQRDALERLHGHAENAIGEKRAVIDRLHRDFAGLTHEFKSSQTEHRTAFDQLMGDAQTAHSEARRKHDDEMVALRAAFREEMGLRAPVEYWQAKAEAHSRRSRIWMWCSFISMAALAGLLAGGTTWVMSTLTDNKPDPWKFAIVVLAGVIGVWAVRLIVRMFLSNSHLATDAEERVTMVKTYLSLIEAGKMPLDEDRKLVLTPLFRPAADGLIKDEGLPHPMLELLTRSTK